jgi:AcrR family transcriptional regulator
MVRTVGDRGYAETSVGAVARRAGVSREAFYSIFRDKEDCFVRAYDAVIRRVMGAVLRAYEQQQRWPDRVRSGLETLLTFISYEEALARVAMIEVHGAGPRAVGRYQAALRGFVPYLDAGRAESRYGERLPTGVSEAVVGGVAQIIYGRVIDGEATDILAMAPDLLYFTLTPYLGHSAALKAANRARVQGGADHGQRLA